MKSIKSLYENSLLTAPGVFDGLSAKLAVQSGFAAVYASGGAIARSTGKPDIGLLTLTEVTFRLSEIVTASNVPVIADADTGFGNELNTIRTVEEFERIGVSALHLEDQTFPKRCGHLAGKSLVSINEMCHKIKVALQARKSEKLLIIARTDAIAVEGFQKAIERAKQYVSAGAEMLFVEAPETRKQIEQIAIEVPGPKLINMFYGGKTPLVSTKELAQMGYNVIIIPSDVQRAAIKSMQLTLRTIHSNGNSESISTQLCSFDEREKIIGTEEYLKSIE